LSTLVSTLQTALLAIKNKALRDVSESRHLEMAAIQKRLTDRETLQGIVNDLARDVEQLEIQYRTFQLLAQALSPTEGLIAQRLREAIFSIVDQMNAVISSVWSHELRIMECGFEQSDLDYKFPVYVESPDNLTPDISRASKGQQEMINIAFKLTAMLYLDLLDYPLFMDEPGEGFDEQHRDQIMSLIRQMLDSGHYSQLFMVSHFASNHGAFLDAEILALDTSNIALPGIFNEHVVLE
jgi:DNA repair exonuclease SbcCD ATPase subunit